VKPAFIFVGNAEVDYFRLRWIVHALIRVSRIFCKSWLRGSGNVSFRTPAPGQTK
jgi:hypothetical protein